MNRHTPGPWEISGTEYQRSVRGGKGRLFCAIAANERYAAGEKDANVRLIVAAPDMYDVLEQCLIHMNAKKLAGLWKDHDERLLRKVRQVIDKAEGRT